MGAAGAIVGGTAKAQSLVLLHAEPQACKLKTPKT